MVTRIPSEYQEVEYLESTGTQYIDTGVVVRSDITETDYYEVDCSVEFPSLNGSSTNVFWSYTPSSSAGTWIGVSSNNKFTATGQTTSLADPSQRNHVVSRFYKKSQVVTINDDVTTTNNIVNFREGSFTLFADKNLTYVSNARFYKASISFNSELQVNLIPCYRISDNVLGMYDTVSKTFFTNAGTGTFLVGHDVTHSTVNLLESRRRILLSTPHIESKSSLSPLSFSTDVVTDLKECKIHFSPIQEGSGTPSPENVRPITGWDGIEVTRCRKNIFSQSTFENVGWATRFLVMENALNDLLAGTYTISYTSTVTSVKDTFTSETALADTAGMIILYNNKNVWTVRDNITRAQALAHYSVDKSLRFTISSEDVGKIEAVYMYGIGRDKAAEGAPNGSLGTATFSNIQLERGSTATPYEPYQGESYDIDFPSEAGTVYGGTLDLKTGELVVDRAMVDLGTLNWGLNSAGSFGAAVTRMKTEGNLPDNAICDYYPIVNNGYNGAHSSEDKVMWQYTDTNYIRVRDSAFSANEQIKAELAEHYLCYKLATPITYPMTPQPLKSLRGLNNILTDANGNIDIKFYSH